MKRTFLCTLMAICLQMVLTASEVPASVELWKDPQANALNRLRMSATFPMQGKRLSLDGTWKFLFYELSSQEPGYRNEDSGQWDEITVPGMFELQGYGDPVYLNVGYAWRGHYENNPPYVPQERNYAGQYRRDFFIDETWADEDVFLHVGSATSNLRVWINGNAVGYSEDSKLEARFDVTPYVKPGNNEITLEIHRWCDGTYLEDQDFWRFTGIGRSVYLYSRPKERIEDINVTADMYGNVMLAAEFSRGVKSAIFHIADAYGTVVGSVSVPVKDGRCAAEVKVDDPRLWSAETPELYTLKLVASDSQGNTTDRTEIEFGFRTVEVVGNQLLVNGRPVLIKGVNRHEMNPYNGYVVSEKDMIRDIMIMKRLNINAVRCCHYPNDPLWYSLCDRYGLYVVDEANLESHGMGYGEKTLAKVSMFERAHLERIMRMVRRDFNHPSVIIWSLGNEAGFGDNFIAGYKAVKAADDSRPVQYERAVYHNDAEWTDVFCPMYFTYEECRKYLENNPNKPLIQCEYAHAMGNSLGGFKEYWDLVRKYPAYQGGFIWDFADQALVVETGSKFDGTDHVYAFGGDFNDHDPSDGSFCSNGLVTADRTFHPHAYEVAYQYRNIHTSAGDSPGRITIYNEYDFIDLSRYDMHWKLEADGKALRCGSEAIPAVAPRQRVEVSLDVPESLLSACDGCDLYLTVWYVLNQADGILPAGTVVAYDQIMLAEAPQEIETDLSGVPEIAYNADGDILLSGSHDGGRRLCEWEAVFSASDGALTSYTVAGRELVESALEPCFVRALTENDIGAKLGQKQEFWRTLELECDSFSVAQDEEKCVIEVTYKPIEDMALVGCTYHVYADGRIDGVMSLVDAGALKQAPMIPRVGMRMAMPGEYSTFEYYGLGPFENYADRCSGALVGRYSHRVEDMYHYGYVRPQESGNRTGLEWAKVVNDDGMGLMVTSPMKFSASALPFSVEEMDVEMNGRPQYHSLELKRIAFEDERSRGRTWLHFDLCQMGLGCIDSWGALPREEYRIPAQDYEFAFTLVPVFD